MMERSIHGQFHKPHHLGSLPSKFIQVDKAPHPPWSASVKGCVVWNVKGSDETVATSQRKMLKVEFHMFTHLLDTSLTYRDISRGTGSELEGCPKDMAQLCGCSTCWTMKAGPPQGGGHSELEAGSGDLRAITSPSIQAGRGADVAGLEGWKKSRRTALNLVPRCW